MDKAVGMTDSVAVATVRYGFLPTELSGIDELWSGGLPLMTDGLLDQAYVAMSSPTKYYYLFKTNLQRPRLFKPHSSR